MVLASAPVLRQRKEVDTGRDRSFLNTRCAICCPPRSSGLPHSPA